MTDQFFFLSLAGLSLSVMGFAGLLTAFRRGQGWTRIELWRLRKIVETAMWVMFLSLLTFPIQLITTSEGMTVAAVSVLSLAYTLYNVVGTLRERHDFGTDQSWVVWYVGIGAAHAALFVGAIVAGSVALLMLGLLLLYHFPVQLFARQIVEFRPTLTND